MKFGVVDKDKLDQIDLKLPEDPKENVNLLKSIFKQNIEKFIYIGTSVWADPSFKDKLYPKGTKPKDYLSIYSKYFNYIELNSTFYGIPPIERIINWKNSVSHIFKFCPKVPQTISHRKNIHEQFIKLESFFKIILKFEENLGVVFMQLPKYFGPNEISNLEKFLEQIPPNINFAIELRHPDWFYENNIKEVMNLFLEKGISAIITDTPGRRDVLHQTLTTDFTFIRFVGNNLHLSDFVRIDDWIIKINQWLNKGLKTIYFFIHQPTKVLSFDLFNYFKMNDEINKYLLK